MLPAYIGPAACVSFLPVEQNNVLLADRLELLDRRTKENVMRLVAYLLNGDADVEGYVECGVRACHSHGLSARKVRNAIRVLMSIRWIEKAPRAQQARDRFRFTPTFRAETALQAPQRLVTPTDPFLIAKLSGVTAESLFERLFQMNKQLQGRPGGGYDRRTLWNVARVLAWCLSLASGNGWFRFSLRHLARETGLVFRVARHARDLLAHWQILRVESASLYGLDQQALHNLLGAGGTLPKPPRRNRKTGVIGQQCHVACVG